MQPSCSGCGVLQVPRQAAGDEQWLRGFVTSRVLGYGVPQVPRRAAG